MVKYQKNFDLLLGEINDYWGEHDLGQFIDNLLQSADRLPQVRQDQVSAETEEDTRTRSNNTN